MEKRPLDKRRLEKQPADASRAEKRKDPDARDHGRASGEPEFSRAIAGDCVTDAAIAHSMATES